MLLSGGWDFQNFKETVNSVKFQLQLNFDKGFCEKMKAVSFDLGFE